MRITQFGLCYSPNLGDGIIAECIAYGLRERRPGVQVTAVDLSGRNTFGAVTIRNREALLTVLDRLPRSVRHRLALWKLNRIVDRVEAQWRAALVDCDLAIVGGGQIMSDTNLNFPIKVGRAARLLEEQGVPTAIYAVGVARNWTSKGKQLFAPLLETDLRLVAPRDGPSAEAWRAQVTTGPDPIVAPDPGLLAAACYGPVAAEAELIGLCVTDFGLLCHHADGGVAGAASGGVRFYASLARVLIARGWTVQLFTNGAAEDQALRRRVGADLRTEVGQGRVRLPVDPERPSELAKQVAPCAGVLAHRLHACIIAYSYGRPIVGLGWDQKLQSFFASVGLESSFTDSTEITADCLADLMERAMDVGVSAEQHGAVLEDAWAGIDRLLACVSDGTG